MNTEIEETGSRVLILGVAFLLVMLAGLFVLWHIFGNTNEPPSIESLTERCEAANGVVLEGINDQAGVINHFVVCVPYEALTCIDVE